MNFISLLKKSLYKLYKIKFKSIKLNKTFCLNLYIIGNILVWGQNKEGLLELGYDITSVEAITIFETRQILKISLSGNHAVVIN